MAIGNDRIWVMQNFDATDLIVEGAQPSAICGNFLTLALEVGLSIENSLVAWGQLKGANRVVKGLEISSG